MGIFGAGVAYGLDTQRGDDWRARVACAAADDPEIFSPLPGDYVTVNLALKFCARCPVKAECLADAIATGDVHTIRGGKTPHQRVTRRRKKAITALNEQRQALGVTAASRATKRGGMCAALLHEMTEDNMFLSADGYPCCKQCRSDNQRLYRQRVAERGRQARELQAAGVS